MSANDHTTAHEEDHSGPIKTPQQLLAAVFFSFVVPIFVIIALVYYVTSQNKPASGAVDVEKAVAQRIQKIGVVDIRDANRALKPGAEVFTAQCATCHAVGAAVAAAPKLGDVAAWGPRLKTGFEALVNSALKGKGLMGPQGGGDFDDVEIARAVAHMANSAGGKFAEPQKAAAAATADAAVAAPAAPAATAVAAPQPVVVAAAAPAPATAAKAGAGEALYKQACFACHAASVAGSPKFGDKAAWAPRIKTGVDALTASVIKGKGAMPPKGGSSASDADIRAAVEYMVSAAK
ncbi:MAG TPA: c-type cytochrome [Polaromonas sp.]|uniref:c-type cytochrome n=1 Tax=Polaromonas sp. TaxID=1869339 RepID=UPI002D5686B9|nr:c-type cytochrome [Polaromonas sp.]HYW57163.1 c-type cytochrome [Polaromonas sp.]